MKKSIYKFLPIIGLMAAFTACDENGDGTVSSADVEQKLSTFFIDAEAIASNLYTIVDFSIKDSTLGNNDTVSIMGAQVSLANDTYTVDYGSGTVGPDGLTRKGQIIATETGDYLTTNGMVSASFVNYSVDSKTVAGTITVENMGNDQFDMDITSLDYNSEFTYNATKSIQWNSGLSTLNDNSDDQFDISGSSSGSDTTNSSLTANFTSPLRFDRSCQYSILDGVADISLTGDSVQFNSVIANFVENDGSNLDGCNNQVILTVANDNGVSLTLPQIFSGF